VIFLVLQAWIVFAQDQVVYKSGFSIRLPPGRNWNSQEDTSTLFRTGIGSGQYTVIINFEVSNLDLPKLSKAALRERYSDFFKQQELMLRNSKILSRTAKIKLDRYFLEMDPVISHRKMGAVCQLVTLHMLDSRVPGGEGQVFKMPALKYMCFHPLRAGVLAELSYSQRYSKDREGEANIDWQEQARPVIESLNFH
jgi:hypothetical protein